ncbi:sensor histidine kinase [Nocardia uniformis]|uniref:histidine kinase n=1 Tax=Nocardia uniformis TaxID=53432 RepID=A0A849CFD3_9NOCA|nr:histidine kinase [Nocardia uniformis]NNH75425.1 sensor histidine kinase [Nocardia uniformis]
MSVTSSPPRQVARPPWQQRLTPVRGRADSTGPDRIDIAIAIICFAVITGPLLMGWASGIGSMSAIAAFGAAAVAPLIVRRRQPLAVLVVVSAVLCLAAVAGIRFTPWVSNAGLAVAIAVFTLADRRPRRESLLATGIVLIAMGFAARIGVDLHIDQEQNFVQLPIAAVAWLVGDTTRTRREYRQDLAEQQRQRAAEEERRIRAEERLRVSRDVHDLISHTLSMVAVRSGVARLLIDEQPGEARRALSAIETASRSALNELRAVLAQIREPGRPDELGEPGLADIADLVDGLRRHGLVVEYHVVGTALGYPALLQTTVYRIVQEALTNVVKHAHTDRARVEIRHAPHELTASITDDGPTATAGLPAAIADTGSGLGLAGMRERVSLFGGRLDAGPRPEGGFAVTASFPVDGEHHV